MAERFKAHAWKACLEQSNAGSNPVFFKINIVLFIVVCVVVHEAYVPADPIYYM